MNIETAKKAEELNNKVIRYNRVISHLEKLSQYIGKGEGAILKREGKKAILSTMVDWWRGCLRRTGEEFVVAEITFEKDEIDCLIEMLTRKRAEVRKELEDL